MPTNYQKIFCENKIKKKSPTDIKAALSYRPLKYYTQWTQGRKFGKQKFAQIY